GACRTRGYATAPTRRLTTAAGTIVLPRRGGVAQAHGASHRIAWARERRRRSRAGPGHVPGGVGGRRRAARRDDDPRAPDPPRGRRRAPALPRRPVRALDVPALLRPHGAAVRPRPRALHARGPHGPRRARRGPAPRRRPRRGPR